jgi:hypothetical protein
VTDYPILKVVQPGHKLWATGEIHTITVNSILLKDVVLEFDTVTDAKMAEAKHECRGKGTAATMYLSGKTMSSSRTYCSGSGAEVRP